jgi:hypothetical protein
MSWFRILAQITLAVIVFKILMIIVAFALVVLAAKTATKSPFLPFSPVMDAKGRVVPGFGPYCKDNSDCESGYCYQNYACHAKIPSGGRCEKDSACVSNVCVPAINPGSEPNLCA